MIKNSSKPKILIVDNSIAITGALKSILSYAISLESEFDFIFVLPKNSLATNTVKQSGFQVFELPFVEISKSFKKLIYYFPFLLLNSYRLKKIIAAKSIHIIHMNDFYNMVGVGAKLLGTNAILVTHVRFLPEKFLPALSKVWAKVNLKFSGKILCVSEAVKKFFPTLEQVVLLPDSVPSIEKHPIKEILPSQDKEVKLLYLSNFILGKGQDYALEAFKIAFSQNSNLRLHFAGGDMGLEKNKAFRDKLEEEVLSKGLGNVVSFSSFVTDVEKEVKRADILLNFSESESFSLTCLDALFYGTPLIATDCGGPAELFEDGKSGILVPNKDINAMVHAILDLSSDFDKRQKFALEGKKYVKSKFSIERNSNNLKVLYYDVLLPFSNII